MEFTPIYMAVVMAIAAILLFAIVKPMFQSSVDYSAITTMILPLLH